MAARSTMHYAQVGTGKLMISPSVRLTPTGKWNELRRFAKKGSSMKLIFFEHDITKKSEFMDMKQFLNYDPSASAADTGFSFKH